MHTFIKEEMKNLSPYLLGFLCLLSLVIMVQTHADMMVDDLVEYLPGYGPIEREVCAFHNY
jgi:hypothetical protein